MAFHHRNCCARCSSRTDTSKNIGNKRKIRTKWLVDFFKHVKRIDIKIYKYLCLTCFKILENKHKSDTLFEEASIQYGDLKKSIVKKKKAEVKSDVFDHMDSNQLFKTIGLHENQLNALMDELKEFNLNSNVTLKTAICFFLARLRLGLSINKLISLIPIASRSQAGKIITQVRHILVESFVPRNLGVKQTSRWIINKDHTTELSMRLFEVDENKIITVWDGTYIYIQKSSSHSLQKVTYSMHKGFFDFLILSIKHFYKNLNIK
jgi:hypothetical protein